MEKDRLNEWLRHILNEDQISLVELEIASHIGEKIESNNNEGEDEEFESVDETESCEDLSD